MIGGRDDLSLKIILVVLLVASLTLNVSLVLSQNDQKSLEINNLRNEVSRLNDEISRLNMEKSEPEKIQSSLIDLTGKNVDFDGQSITSVGVRPVLLNDGFFGKTVYEGTTMEISVSVRDGTGLILVNTEIPTGIDFQSSARAAVSATENYLGRDLSDKDIIFSISVDDNSKLKAVDGESAGAAMAILLISELTGTEIKKDILMTGSIMPDGTIGMVGGIYEKAQAAGNYNAEIFLVPKGQGVTFVESCEESGNGPIIYRSCKLEQKPISPITEDLFNMRIFEVGNLEEALSYFVRVNENE